MSVHLLEFPSMPRLIIFGLAIAAALIAPWAWPAQQVAGSVITGRVLDAETGSPVENVIVFLANTPRGTSSAKDGTFRLAKIPQGTYDLVFSCVGYQRQILPLRTEKPEHRQYEIRLKPRPIQTGGVEVLGKRYGEAALKLQGLLFPRESPGTYCQYGVATSIPIGVFFADSGFYMYSLEAALIDSEKYVRLWLLYKNISRTPYDLDPMRCAKLTVRKGRYVYKDIRPDPPSRISAEAGAEKAVRTISETIGTTLQAEASIQEQLLGRSAGFDMASTEEERGGKSTEHDLVRAGRTLMSPIMLNDRFRRSVSQGVLGRNTVFPGNSVNGYMYFPFPGLSWKAKGKAFPEASEYTYKLELVIRNGSKMIEFTPGGI